ncbi:hypothetical protein HMF7854_03675 [Sphingomonas ginkgonis]|uniref:CBU-0592-like domain-containing protein n=1 Tax=Sphingomonas ginkgonis TaxID=2315330 RepID=A0A3R9YL67_9SPHN|nr:hypothetical protein [Sphingomonas ginkgonis]RST30027.1 hypothetical protein HMF7854_03675 [Sphingomonas ginkgonis]
MALGIDLIGWAAAGLILAAYALLTAGRLSGDSAAYQWLNVAGAAGFVLNSGWHGAVPSAVLNVVWAGIGIVALVRLRSRGRRAPR